MPEHHLNLLEYGERKKKIVTKSWPSQSGWLLERERGMKSKHIKGLKEELVNAMEEKKKVEKILLKEAANFEHDNQQWSY